MTYNYIVSAQKATSVSDTTTGCFVRPGEMNLFVAKNTNIEIFAITHSGLQSFKSFGIFGEIAIMKTFRFPGDDLDKLFVLTNSYDVMILEANLQDETNQSPIAPINILTKVSGNVMDRIGRPSETGIIGIIDPQARMIGLRLYDAMFKVIYLSKEMTEIKSFSIRLDELSIVDIAFIHGFTVPTIMMLHQDAFGRHAKVYDISLQNKEFVNRNWNQENVENEATMIIPVSEPLCGALIIGLETISYLSGNEQYITIGPPSIQQSSLCCYTPVDKDGSRYILGDISGRLFMLILETERNSASSSGAGGGPSSSSTAMDHSLDDKPCTSARRSRTDYMVVPCLSKDGYKVVNIRLEFLGEVSIPGSITYLDNGVVFIGSRLGDSQLIKLHNDEFDISGSYIEVLDTYTNLGPITDMCIVDLEKQGQGQLITCSGGFKDGSLRIIRNGIGINETITIDLPLIKGIWALKVDNEYDNYLVLSFINETRILKLGSNEEVEESDISGFDLNSDTYYSGNVIYNQLIQVTTSAVNLISVKQGKRVFTWVPPAGVKLFVTNCTDRYIAIGSGLRLFYLEIMQGEIILLCERTFENEIACVDISPLQGISRCCAIGMWTNESVHLVSLPDLHTLTTESIDVELIPRSILQLRFEETNYLLITIGDGSLYYYVINDECTELTKRKRVVLGTQPISLRAMQQGEKGASVFACSDRPTVIYSSSNKIVFSNVNLKQVSMMCPLNSEVFNNSLVMVNEKSLTIGKIDEMQKLHIRTIPMGETVRRIIYQESTETFGVLTLRQEFKDEARNKGKPASKSTSNLMLASSQKCSIQPITNHDVDEVETHSFIVMDQNTFEVKATFQFLPYEFANAICVVKFNKEQKEYFAIGTAYMNNEDAEPQRGRVIIISYDKATDKLSQICFIEVNGAVYSICSFQGKLLVTVNSMVQLYEFTADRDMRHVCSNFNNIIALYAKVSGDFILVGDLMRSITVLLYRSQDKVFEEVARDFNSNWMTSLDIFDCDTYIGAENSSNLFCCHRNHNPLASEAERKYLMEAGFFHLGEFVNVFRQGSLVMQNQIDRAYPTEGNTLIGAISGYIGFNTRLNQNMYELLSELERNLSKMNKNFGNINHADWRAFRNEHRKLPCTGFIDGDFVETFLDLNLSQMNEVHSGINEDKLTNKTKPSLDEIVKMVEELSRIH